MTLQEFAPTSGTVPHTSLGDIDRWLSADDVFRASVEENRMRRRAVISNALSWHLDRNPAYRAYAHRFGIEDGHLSNEEALERVPLLPAGVFKRSPELVRTPGDEALDTTSSGTQGTVSLVPRDNTTMMRFFASVAAGTKELLDIEHSETVVHNVGPRLEETRHLWISYVMAGVSVLHETDSFVTDGRVEADRLVAALADAPPTAPSLIVGPPPLLWDLSRRLLDEGPLPTHPRRFLVTIGGWKRRQEDMVSRKAFDEVVGNAFGLPDIKNIRDAFNMVELNTVMLECAERRKHCPPWIHVTVRDPHTLLPVAPESPGILGYLDPTPTSFPGMVLSEDFGRVERDVACECGITGDVVTIERRINRLESRGCAMKI